MLPVVVLTVAFAALGDAGYHYNAPAQTYSSNANHNQLRNIQPAYVSPPRQVEINSNQDKSVVYTVTYKDYYYVKNDNMGGNGQQPISTSQDNLPSGYSYNVNHNAAVQHIGTPSVALVPPPTSINHNLRPVQPTLPAASSNYHQTHHHHLDQTPWTPIANVHANNGYTENSHGTNFNIGHPHTVSASSGANYNYQAQPVPLTQSNYNSVNPGHLQTTVSLGNSNYNHINAGHSHTSAPLVHSHYNNANTGYSQSLASQANLNSGYSQNTHSHFVQNLNVGYVQSLTPPSRTNQNNAFVQNSAPLHVSLNTGFTPKYSPPASVSDNYAQVSTGSQNNVHNGYTPTLSSSNVLSSNIYSQQPIASVNNLNNGYTQTSVSIGSNTLNSGIETSTPSNVIINSGYAQPLSSSNVVINSNIVQEPSPSLEANVAFTSNQASSVASSSSSSYIQTSSSSLSTLNNGFVSSTLSPPVDLDEVQINFNSNSGNVDASVTIAPEIATVTPRVFKHIYFHAPPPELEEEEPKVLPPPPPPKKSYKIIFIKVPSQQPKANIARLQQLAQQQNAASEEKTLIYVLSKHPEPQPSVIVPEPKPSKHEVFFVKYNGNPFEIASQVNEEISKTGSVESIAPTLEPGLANGRK